MIPAFLLPPPRWSALRYSMTKLPFLPDHIQCSTCFLNPTLESYKDKVSKKPCQSTPRPVVPLSNTPCCCKTNKPTFWLQVYSWWSLDAGLWQEPIFSTFPYRSWGLSTPSLTAASQRTVWMATSMLLPCFQYSPSHVPLSWYLTTQCSYFVALYLLVLFICFMVTLCLFSVFPTGP